MRLVLLLRSDSPQVFALAALCLTPQTGASAQPARGDPGLKQNLPAESALYYGSVMEKAPALYWRLDEASGTKVHDASGNNKTGTIAGAVAYSQPGATGDRGDTAISLDGSSGYVRANSYAPFASYSRRTFVLLLKWDRSQPGVRNIFGGSGTLINGVSDDMRFPVLETNADVFANPVLVWFHSIARQFPIGDVWSKEPSVRKWMHIVLTVDDSASTIEDGVKLWINGALVGSPSNPWVGDVWPAPFDAQAGRFMFGTRFNAYGNLEPEFIDGTYDEVAIYERILSDAEIQDLATDAQLRR